jgi:hypothetical protein
VWDFACLSCRRVAEHDVDVVCDDGTIDDTHRVGLAPAVRCGHIRETRFEVAHRQRRKREVEACLFVLWAYLIFPFSRYCYCYWIR